MFKANDTVVCVDSVGVEPLLRRGGTYKVRELHPGTSAEYQLLYVSDPRVPAYTPFRETRFKEATP